MKVEKLPKRTCSPMHDGVVFIITRIDVGTSGQERLDQGHVAVDHCEVERGESVGVPGVGQRRRSHQHAVRARRARRRRRARAARRAVVQRAPQPAVTHAN